MTALGSRQFSITLLLAFSVNVAEAQLRTALVADGLTRPVAFVADPTSASRFFIVEQGGLIRVLENGVLRATPLLDLRLEVDQAAGEGGLLGMAFAPDTFQSGRFFLNFTNSNGDTVVARFRRTPASAVVVDPATRFDLRWPGGLLYIDQPFANHNGGHLAFGPDGYLYIGLGDGGSANDPENRAQSPSVLLGKMLRLDVAVPDSDPEGYNVPPDNPFLDGQPIPALPEIWSFGLRNPWRYSFDDLGAGATGALVIADVGQATREEVNYEPFGAGGRNYGWSVREGTVATPGVPSTRQPAYLPLTGPVFDYARSAGRAVTGGFVYRGTQLPQAYRGRYFVADSSTALVGSIALDVNPVTREGTLANAVDHTAELGGPLGSVVSFGRDLEGELYLVTFSGRVLKIVSVDQPASPASLSASVAGRTVMLNWIAPSVPGLTGYRLEAGSSSGAADVAVFTTGAVTGVTVADVPEGLYFVRVRGVNNQILGPPSNEVRVTVNCAPPGPPLNLVAATIGNTVRLDWTAAPGATGYVVEAGSAPGLADVASHPVGLDPGLVVAAPAGRYFVRVRSAGPCGVGASSNEIMVTAPQAASR